MANKRIKILVIDDIQDNLITLNALIKESFPDAISLNALNGQTGLELAAAEDPDVILLDIIMPVMDGYEVCKNLKANKKLRDIPVVFVTANKDTKENRIRALESGGEAFLPKPIDEIELTAQIRAMIKIRKANIQKRDEKEHLTELVDEKTRELKINYISTLNLFEDLKRENEARIKSEERFKQLFLQAPLGIASIDSLTGHIYSVNPMFAKIACRTIEEMETIDWMSITHPDDVQEVLDKMARMNRGETKGFHMEKRYLQKDGNVVLIHMTISPIQVEDKTNPRHLCMIEDITERKFAEKKLESSQKDLLNSQKIAKLGHWKLNPKTMEVSGSLELISILGISVKELSLKDFYNVLHPLDKEEFLNYIQLGLEEGEPFDIEHRLLINNDIQKWIRTIGEVKLANDGTVSEMTGIVQDITERKQAENALQMSEKQNRSITQTAADAIISINSEGIILSWNIAAEKIFGYSSSEMINENLKGIVPLHHIAGHNAGIQRLRDSEKENILGKTIELTAIRKNRTEFPIELSLSSWQSSDEKFYTGIIRDITKRKRSEKIQKVLYNISNAVIAIDNLKNLFSQIQKEIGAILDSTNFYIALYDEKTDMFSLPFLADEKEDFTTFPAGKTFTNYVLKSQKSLLTNKEKVKEMVKTGDIELIGPASEIWLGVPLKSAGKGIGVLAVQSYSDEFAYNESDKEMLEFISDHISIVIERKKAEDDLKMALEKATESDRLKSAFLANMSHEIRTPLNSIIGFSKIISKRGEDNDENRKMRYFIEHNSNVLIKIIDDIIDISKIEAGIIKFSNESINLHNFLTDIYNSQKQILDVSEKDRLELHYHKHKDDIIISADKFRLSQILNNLISNAIKYTEEGSVKFGFSLIDNRIQFYVKDTGIGIPKNEITNIFRRFYRVKNQYETIRGLGLGLSIVKLLIEKMNGKIWLESEVEKGSIFNFSLLYQKASISICEEQNEYNHAELKGKLILVAEDDDGNFFLTNILLEEMGAKVLRAENGLEAVEICKENDNISFVLMDIKMPIMDGLEATMLIREFKKDLLIVALSAHVIEEVKTSVLNAGCNDFISKPIKEDRLIAIMHKYFKK